MMSADIRNARAAGCPDRILVRAMSYECADCEADTSLRHDRLNGGHSWVLQVAHDIACPTLARQQAVGVA